ncbi:sec-independent translocase [Naumannella halotolerans]|uniref:Sec-independent protein translocase protein TatB n=1 Tax=Naumannella halotolerans TaxID=993414 RepID=A0A4R7J5P8_9ACTN|nr:sec-independent translocase [Naumannella halotolerans]TDT32682.1 sec-independent protein translocase protein TatB [Naumannella halotolerans]
MGLGAAEIAVLVILAVVLFGPEKLPGIARKAARVLRYVRTIANDATGQIRRELGPDYADFDVRDLNPRTFVAKHLLSDVEPIVADVKKSFEDVDTLGRETSRDMKRALGSNSSSPTPRTSPGRTRSSMTGSTAAKAAATTVGATAAAEGTQVAVAARPDFEETTVAFATTTTIPWDHEAT